VALVLTRQALPTLDPSVYAPATGIARGAYVLADSHTKFGFVPEAVASLARQQVEAGA
jgi:transketolase